jgi:hypothetical protein
MTKLQGQMLDQFIDVWQQQLKSPAAAQFMSALQGAGGGFQNAPAFSGLANGPLEFWMQAALAWQRNMLSMWTGGDQSRHH